MRIHWFNPENDLALANGSATYTPPQSARKLQAAGAVLPLWYADDDDRLLCYGVNSKWLKQIREDFGVKVALFNHMPEPGQYPDPWGWSAYARRFFEDEGFAKDCMPDDAALDMMRRLSHRHTAVEVAELLHQRLPNLNLAPAAYEAFSLDDVRTRLVEHPHSYIKQPWSSSGRGVLDVTAVSEVAVMKMADDSIRLQGSVMIEPAYDRVVDFARIYECRDGVCYDLGTSVFTVDKRGGYSGNVLAPEEKRLDIISRFFDRDDLLAVFEALRQIIEERIAPYYQGVLGVDMLIDSAGMLDAVVEINLRKTMGYVANRIMERYVHPDAAFGVFQVVRTDDFTPCVSNYEVAEHRLLKGCLRLTPNNPDFTFAINI